MDRKIVETEAAPCAVGPYSQAVVSDGWIYASGQIALDPETGEMATGGVVEEAHRAIRNLSAVLEAAGGSLASVVRATVYLADLGDFQAVNDVYASYFGDRPPARACVEVAALPKGALVEIDAVARVE